MAFPKGITKIVGVGATITNPNGPTTTITVGAGVSPATTVTGPDAFGASAVVGTGVLYARNDHDHGLPANPQRSPATTVTGPDSFGASAVVGTSVLFARQDHDHGLPAAPADLPLAGGTMSGPIAMGANKITGLANGTAATDAAAFGQVPTIAESQTAFLVASATVNELLEDHHSFVYDPVGLSGQTGNCLTSVPVLVAPGGVVAGGVASIGFTVSHIDTTADAFDLTGKMLVSNLTGTQVIGIIATGSVPMVGPDQSGTIDFTTGTPTAIAGTDLVWTAATSTLTTTAGGVFVVSIQTNGSWD